MASAEQLLNEAQYAFQSITFGDSRENRRNAARAKSLCRKIFRKYPGTSEAVVAHGIMMRLGEKTPMPRMPDNDEPGHTIIAADIGNHGSTATQSLDWTGLLAVIFASSKAVLAVIVVAGFLLFGILGPLLFLPLLAIVFLASPLRRAMQPGQRRQVDAFITRANAWIRERRSAGRGLV